MIRGRALRLLWAACLALVLALPRGAAAQNATPGAAGENVLAQNLAIQNPVTRLPAAQLPPTQNVATQGVVEPDVTAQGDSGPRDSGLSRSDIKSLTHALDKVADSSDAASPAKLFRWAVGDPDLGQSLDEPEDLDGDDIETDRPDFTQNRKTVGRGVVQLEQGMTYLQGRKNSFNDFSFPETLLRLGILADWLELRLSQNFASDRTNLPNGKHQTKTGAQDMVCGVKLALTEQRGWLPEMGMIIHSSAPTGSPGFSTPGMLLPGVNWLYGWDITKRWSLSGSTQAYKTTDLVPLPTSRGGISALDHVQHAFIVVAQSFSLEYEVTDKLTPYFEWFLLAPSGAMDPTKNPQHYLDSGFTYKVTPNIQLDARAGMGLSPYSTALFAGSGLSLRF